MKKNKHGFGYAIGHFFKHYGGILLLSMVCAAMTVLMIAIAAK